jgi:hypothetical protein
VRSCHRKEDLERRKKGKTEGKKTEMDAGRRKATGMRERPHTSGHRVGE